MPLLTLLATAQAGTESIDKVQQLLQKLLDWGINAGGHIIGALLIFLIGRFLIGILNKMLARILERRHVDAGIQSFTKSLVNILLTVLLIVAIVNKLGVETTSFAAFTPEATDEVEEGGGEEDDQVDQHGAAPAGPLVLRRVLEPAPLLLVGFGVHRDGPPFPAAGSRSSSSSRVFRSSGL